MPIEETMAAQEALPIWFGVAGGLIGLVLIFAGYKLLRAWSRVATALNFAAIGLAFAGQFNQPVIGIVAAVCLGILGYLLGDFFYYVNMVIMGAAAGAILGGLVTGAHPVGLVAGAVLGGILGFVWERPIAILATSVIGSALVGTGVWAATVSTGIAEHTPKISLAYVGLIILAAVLGCVVQAKSTRNLPSHREEQAQKAKQ